MRAEEEPFVTTMRYVVVKGSRYVSINDVVELLRTVGGTEETDVRNRLNVLASNLLKATTK